MRPRRLRDLDAVRRLAGRLTDEQVEVNLMGPIHPVQRYCPPSYSFATGVLDRGANRVPRWGQKARRAA